MNGWTDNKTYHMGYVDKNIQGWKRAEDTGVDMLECPKCECRVQAIHYITAVGTKGFNFCPYCGEDLRPEQISLFEREET